MSDNESNVRYWRNQHGAGIVIEGYLAALVNEICEETGMSPEEFLEGALTAWEERHG